MTEFNRDDYTHYRLQRAKETLIEIRVLLENKFWNTAVNRMYYASFYAVGALLYQKNIETSSHSGSRQKFGLLFVQTGLISREYGKHYSELFEKRQKGDYDDFFDIDQETALRLFPITVELIAVIEDLIKR